MEKSSILCLLLLPVCLSYISGVCATLIQFLLGILPFWRLSDMGGKTESLESILEVKVKQGQDSVR